MPVRFRTLKGLVNKTLPFGPGLESTIGAGSVNSTVSGVWGYTSTTIRGIMRSCLGGLPAFSSVSAPVFSGFFGLKSSSRTLELFSEESLGSFCVPQSPGDGVSLSFLPTGSSGIKVSLHRADLLGRLRFLLLEPTNTATALAGFTSTGSSLITMGLLFSPEISAVSEGSGGNEAMEANKAEAIEPPGAETAELSEAETTEVFEAETEVSEAAIAEVSDEVFEVSV